MQQVFVNKPNLDFTGADSEKPAQVPSPPPFFSLLFCAFLPASLPACLSPLLPPASVLRFPHTHSLGACPQEIEITEENLQASFHEKSLGGDPLSSSPLPLSLPLPLAPSSPCPPCVCVCVCVRARASGATAKSGSESASLMPTGKTHRTQIHVLPGSLSVALSLSRALSLPPSLPPSLSLARSLWRALSLCRTATRGPVAQRSVCACIRAQACSES